MQLTEQELITNLQAAIKDQNHDLVYNFSEKLLKLHPNDIDYKEVYALSSIKTNNIKNLQATIFKTVPTQDRLYSVYAFYLYTAGELKQAIKFLQANASPKTNLLLAQCYFKMLNYDKSAQLMKGLLKEKKLDQTNKQSYTINLFATGVNNNLNDKTLKQYTQIITKNTCKEIFFNYSILLYEMGKIQQCYEQLKIFQSLLDPKQDEIDMISAEIFKSYILHQQGKLIISEQLLQKYAQQTKVKDPNLRGVINCNLLAWKKQHEDFHEALRTLDQCMSLQAKVSRTQLILLKINKCTLYLSKSKINEATKLIKEIQEQISQDTLLQNDQYIKNKYYLLKKNKQADNIAQLFKQLNENNKKQLAWILELDYNQEHQTDEKKLQSIKMILKQQNPILKSYALSLLVSDEKMLEKGAQYLDQLAKGTKDLKVLFILQEIYEKSNKRDKVKDILKRVLEIDPKNSEAQLKIGQILLQQNNIIEAEQLLKGFEGPQEISDISYLQFIERNMHISIKKQQEKIEENIPEHHQKAQMKKRIHKKKKRVRIPKGAQFVQNFKPNPERWLPKWQRKGYKKKGGKRGEGKTQGLATVGKQETKNVFTTGASTSTKEVTKQAQKKRR